MESEGKDWDEIYKETGWFKLDDGKWRFVINDKVEAIDFSAFENISDEGVSLNLVYGNQELLEAYPDLQNIKVVLENMSEYTGGSADISLDEQGNMNGVIKLNKDLVNRAGNDNTAMNYARRAIFHEIQHAIQEKEDFARGGNPASIYDVLVDQLDKYGEELRDISDRAYYIEDDITSKKDDIYELEGILEGLDVEFMRPYLPNITKEELEPIIQEKREELENLKNALELNEEELARVEFLMEQRKRIWHAIKDHDMFDEDGNLPDWYDGNYGNPVDDDTLYGSLLGEIESEETADRGVGVRDIFFRPGRIMVTAHSIKVPRPLVIFGNSSPSAFIGKQNTFVKLDDKQGINWRYIEIDGKKIPFRVQLGRNDGQNVGAGLVHAVHKHNELYSDEMTISDKGEEAKNRILDCLDNVQYITKETIPFQNKDGNHGVGERYTFYSLDKQDPNKVVIVSADKNNNDGEYLSFVTSFVRRRNNYIDPRGNPGKKIGNILLPTRALTSSTSHGPSTYSYRGIVSMDTGSANAVTSSSMFPDVSISDLDNVVNKHTGPSGNFDPEAYGDNKENGESSYNQNNTTVTKGQISFSDNGQALIQLFKASDASTVIHETGHYCVFLYEILFLCYIKRKEYP